MQSSIFTFMYIASAPLALMPAIIALITRHAHRWWLLLLNVGIWGLAYLSLREFIAPGTSQSLVPVPVPVFALGWLGLAAWAFRGANRPKNPTES